MSASMHSAMRAAGIGMLSDYAASASVKLQVYPARPRSINPPAAFVDLIREAIVWSGPNIALRTPTAELVIIHGLFDTKEAADQKDAFVEGFFEWARTRYHEAGGNTVAGITSIVDDPNYVPDWLPPAEQRVYYATRIDLEGFTAG